VRESEREREVEGGRVGEEGRKREVERERERERGRCTSSFKLGERSSTEWRIYCRLK
jgi:hypothetical protein